MIISSILSPWNSATLKCPCTWRRRSVARFYVVTSVLMIYSSGVLRQL